MTYNELEKIIANMTAEERGCDVTIRDEDDEFFAVSGLEFNYYTDVLDEEHPFLTFSR